MRKKTNVKWMPRAEKNLKEVRERITEAGFPKTAKSFVSRLRRSAGRLRNFPEIGWIVEEFGIPSIREIVFEGYRIIYEFDGVKVAILNVHHSSRPLRATHLSGD